MSAKFNSGIAVIGIDIGKNSFHVHKARGDAAAAAQAEAELAKTWIGDRAILQLGNL